MRSSYTTLRQEAAWLEERFSRFWILRAHFLTEKCYRGDSDVRLGRIEKYFVDAFVK